MQGYAWRCSRGVSATEAQRGLQETGRKKTPTLDRTTNTPLALPYQERTRAHDTAHTIPVAVHRATAIALPCRCRRVACASLWVPARCMQLLAHAKIAVAAASPRRLRRHRGASLRLCTCAGHAKSSCVERPRQQPCSRPSPSRRERRADEPTGLRALHILRGPQDKR